MRNSATKYPLTEGAPAGESTDNMNVEPTAQPITFESKPKHFSNVNG